MPFCAGNPPVPAGFPSERVRSAESVSMSCVFFRIVLSFAHMNVYTLIWIAMIWMFWWVILYICMPIRYNGLWKYKGLGTISQTVCEIITEIWKENHTCSYDPSDGKARPNFCSCHGSSTVVAYAKLWSDWSIRIEMMAKQDFNYGLIKHLREIVRSVSDLPIVVVIWCNVTPSL